MSEMTYRKYCKESNMILNVDPTSYNNECYIVGGGPSLINFDWTLLNDKFIIAINRAYEVLPNAQIVYFTDDDFYIRHKETMMKHAGIKVKGSLNPSLVHAPGVIQFHLISDQGLVTQPGCLAHGSNSTYAAINMASVHLGFTKIYLLGVDMKWGAKGDRTKSHWHDGHKRVDPEGAYSMMMAKYNTIVAPLKQRGVEVINVNDPNDTDLRAFPIKSYDEVFGRKYPLSNNQ